MRRSLASEGDGEASIDHNLLACDIRSGIRRKKHGNTGEVARLPPSPQWHPTIEPRDVGLVLLKPRRKLGFEITGTDGIAGDAVFAKFDGQRTSETGEPSLGGDITVDRTSSQHACD